MLIAAGSSAASSLAALLQLLIGRVLLAEVEQRLAEPLAGPGVGRLLRQPGGERRRAAFQSPRPSATSASP